MTGETAIDPTAQRLFDTERPRLVGLAYRMTGTPDDADDIVQDVWLRWQRTDRSSIDNPAGWLTTVTTRLAIDRLSSAQARRETYVGPWLPEPLGPDEGAEYEPATAAVATESLSLGLLRVLETLSPVERAVFLLHDVFGYRFAEVAEAVDRSAEATRQTAVRARRKIRDGRPRIEARPADVRTLTDAFVAAVSDGDIERLMRLLADDVVHVSDGGAEHHAARRPVVGADRVARLLVNLARRGLRPGDRIHSVEVNGQHGLYIVRDGAPYVLMVLGWREGLLAEALAIVNPDKLAHFHSHWTGGAPSAEAMPR